MQRENYRETQLKATGQLPTGRSKPRPTLSQSRIEQLEGLGFNWKVAAPAVGWEHRFAELLDYRRVHVSNISALALTATSKTSEIIIADTVAF